MARKKAIRDHYYISLEGKKIEVSQEVYYAWYGGERQERYQEERARHFGVRTFSSMGDEENDILEALPGAEDTESQVERKEAFRELYAALNCLPEKEREILFEIYFKGHTITQIARREGVDESSIRWRRNTALKKLKEYFEKN
ncbi:sigma-70 family RNA polymerase sigma factor [Anaerotruncus colihominis]|uniref:Sigma-70 family RNA polymerase sigma factor n=1 Tax=Anaerotruncus colihominis TaxID=169435 RepID=A0A845STY9_9FIRM|nr:sigma-70 family RNA polymerase sigma factor [Anaerotruncus colihominis]NDO37734.1 sigma-70 family RNA polymerase sigma factor [Anaerotruncus colihominis]